MTFQSDHLASFLVTFYKCMLHVCNVLFIFTPEFGIYLGYQAYFKGAVSGKYTLKLTKTGNISADQESIIPNHCNK